MTDVDVVVIGAGVVGCAVARALGGYDISVALVDARNDVGDATSKANTALLHTGFDAVPGSLESSLISQGYSMLADYAREVGIPVEYTGAILVAWTQEERDTLPSLRDKAIKNGYHACALLTADEVYAAIPDLGPGALAGLSVPDEAIICPWTTTLAYATQAHARGVQIHLATRVESVSVTAAGTTVHTTRGDIATTWVINAAGMGADVIDRWFGFNRFTVVPRRGQLLVFDKSARSMAPCIVLPVPSSKGKGVLVSPTIFGNVMLGPTAEDLDDRTDTSTTQEGFAFLVDKGRRIMPTLLEEEVTASYAGLRASTEHSDYVVDIDPVQHYVLLGGIRSTGLSASMALAEHIVGLLRESGFDLTARTDVPPPPRMPNIGEAFTRPYQDDDLIRRDPDFGRIVCFCERATVGEVRDALGGPLPARDVDGLRRRTRAMMGRCQGFYCGAEVEALLDRSST